MAGRGRLYKEHRLYQKEEEDLKRTLDKHVANNAEEWDIKNTVRADPTPVSFLRTATPPFSPSTIPPPFPYTPSPPAPLFALYRRY